MMKRNAPKIVALLGSVLFVALAGGCHLDAQDSKGPYQNMAPLDQYLMDRNEEIALARSAAPTSLSQDAEVLVLGRHGYEVAVKGKNGFACIVERSWTAGIDEPDFWDPKRRGPICFNAPAARTYMPLTIKKTELVLAGRSKTQMSEAIEEALNKKELPTLEPGAMSYMLSKQGYLNERVGHWHPHLMFFVPLVQPEAWGAGLAGSPVLANEDKQDHLTIFLIPVSEWSDGTPDADAH